MRILALDTATSACSAALWWDGGVRARRLARMERGQSEALMPMILDVLAEAGCGFSDLDLLAVTVGPGAFTGLRIGLAAARGMALASGVPCLGVTTLEAVAHGVAKGERAADPLLVALDSKRADVYAQVFAPDLAPLGPPQAVPFGGLGGLVPARRILVAGDAAARAAGALAEAGVAVTLSAAPGLPDAATVAGLAALRWRPGEPVEPPAPLYLRPPQAKAATGGGRGRR
ncbi:MAG: tRNA (adenosine(37)-N6)-threonylcarbamoyltransferase complex dimerization subunit type 1 TsaB [Rhodospirillales bacterium]